MHNEEFYIQQVIKGDTAAFAEIVRHYKDLVFTIAFRILKNAEEAEEVAQDSFLKAFRNLSTFRNEAKFSTWLFRIAYNGALSQHRKKRYDHVSTEDRQAIQVSFEDSSNGFQNLKTEQRKVYIGKAMESLSAEEASLVQFFYYSELSIKEIAEITSLDESNIKVKLHRARKRLHIALQSLLKDELEEIL